MKNSQTTSNLRSLLSRYPGIGLWLGIVLYVVVGDLLLAHNHKPTMSRTYGHFLRHPLLGPILAGIWGGLAWHLTVSEPFQWAAEDNLDKNRLDSGYPV